MTPATVTPAREAVDSGYVLEGLVFPIQVVSAAADDEAAESTEVSWGWDWRWNDRDHFEVGLLFGASASRVRPETIQVAVTASFRIVGEVQSVAIGAFAHVHAPALIFPYIRQVVDELTSRSPHGRLLLPPTNVVALMAGFDAAEATGAGQERPASA